MKISKILLTCLTFCSLYVNKTVAQELTMFPSFAGYVYYQEDIKIKKAEVNELMKANEITNFHWKKSKKHQNIATLALGGQLVTAFLALNSLNNSFGPADNKDLIFLASSFGAAGIAIGFSFSSAKLKKKSILGYNKLLKEDGLSYHIGNCNNGIGIVCNF